MGVLGSIRSWIFRQQAAPSGRSQPREREVRTIEPPTTARRAEHHLEGEAPHSEATSDEPAELAAHASEPAILTPRRDRAESADAMAAQARAAERLLEDESLRGDLTDDEFQPLLDWALEATGHLVTRAEAGTDDEVTEVVDAGVGQLREVVRMAARAITAMLDDGPEARDAELRELTAILTPPLVPPVAVDSSRMTLMAALDRVSEDPALAGADLARALAAALSRAMADADDAARGRHAAE